MPMENGPVTEIELKVAIQPEEWASILHNHPIQVVYERRFEDNWLFDTPDRRLSKNRCLLRVRQYGEHAELTWKEPANDQSPAYKIRHEITVQVSDARITCQILQRLGFDLWFRYQKFRTVYRLENLYIMLDETPIGWFVELEGPPEAIEKALKRFGWHEQSRITGTYYDLYKEASRQGKFKGKYLVFSEHSNPSD